MELRRSYLLLILVVATALASGCSEEAPPSATPTVESSSSSSSSSTSAPVPEAESLEEAELPAPDDSSTTTSRDEIDEIDEIVEAREVIDVRSDSIGWAYVGMTRPELEDSLEGTTHELGGATVIGDGVEGFPVAVDGRDAYWVLFDDVGMIEEVFTTDPEVVGPGGVHVGMSLRDAAERYGEPAFSFYHADRAIEYVEFADGFDEAILIESGASTMGGRAGFYTDDIGEDLAVPITTTTYDPNGVIRLLRVVRPFQ